MKKSVIAQIIPLILPLYNESYTLEQILNIGINYLRGLYKTLGDYTLIYPHNPQIVNKWFKYNNYNVINSPYSINDIRLVANINNAIANLGKHNESTHRLFYHTTTWYYSNNVITSLKFHAGTECTDFGLYPCFYLSSTLSNNIEWGQKRTGIKGNETAIIIFSIPKNYSEDIPTIHLKGQLWSDVTTEARQCADELYDIPKLKNYDFVYGDMVANPDDVKRRGQEPRTHNPPKKQLASKSEAADKYLQKCIIGCIYIKKSVDAS